MNEPPTNHIALREGMFGTIVQQCRRCAALLADDDAAAEVHAAFHRSLDESQTV